MALQSYIGRFAPSPTGPLHAGSLVAALASWLDAKAHGGQWLVRMEDVDAPRCVPGTDQVIMQQLAACGLRPDEPPVYQSARGSLYQSALNQLIEQRRAYPCGCSRLDIELAINASGQLDQSGQSVHQRTRHSELVYPGTCRSGLNGKQARSWRFSSKFYASITSLDHKINAQAAPDLIANATCWTDRRLGPQSQNVSAEAGDFVLRRADGLWAYQLAVVVDDAAQGVTHIVRGEDLADNTARQILLQRELGLQQPHYLHTPLVLAANGEKLSKQNGAQALDVSNPMLALIDAGQCLQFVCDAPSPAGWLQQAVAQWAARFKITV